MTDATQAAVKVRVFGFIVGCRQVGARCSADPQVTVWEGRYPGRWSRHRSRVSHFEDRKTGRMWLGEHSVPLRYSSAQA
jgi:hypothetical protein